MQSIIARAAAASALALLLGTSAFAQSGFIGVGVSENEIEVGGAEDDFTGFVLEGAYANVFSGDWAFQLNGEYFYGDTEPDEVDGWAAEGQLLNRNEMRNLGGFLNYSDSDDGDGVLGVGGLAELFTDTFTFGGSLGWFDADAVDSLYGGCAFVRMYGTENFSIEGRGSIVEVDYGPADTSGYGIGAGAEWLFDGTPFSIKGDVDRTELDDADIEATTWMLRGRMHFGERTLIGRDRDGAGSPGGRCILGVAM